jgi:hypothetical protein
MGTLKVMEPKPLTVYPWGEGVGDVRYFTPQILMPSELKGVGEAKGYMPQAYDIQTAIKVLEITMDKASPGVYFAGNPLQGTYGKWLVAMKMAGWKQVPGCALNRVWGNWRNYKGPAMPEVYKKGVPWESPDGQNKWIHAFYYIVPGLKGPVRFDFTSKTRDLKASNGDVDLTPGRKGSLWHINYGGSEKIFKKYPHGAAAWCPNFARLSKSCGVAMGFGLPECGEALDEEFFTIAAQESDKKWPKGWSTFLEYGGLSWATNLPKLNTALTECPHGMTVKV